MRFAGLAGVGAHLRGESDSSSAAFAQAEALEREIDPNNALPV